MSKKNLYTLIVLLCVPAVIIVFFVIPTVFFTWVVDLAPAQIPDKIILSNFNGIDEQYLEITDSDQINEILSLFDNICIYGVWSLSSYSKYNPFRRAPGLSLYRTITFEYTESDKISYKFDYNRIESKGKTYWLLGKGLSKLIDMLDESQPITD